jgi:hypothetical protein
MRLPRPRIPIDVKLAVADRQLRERNTVALFAVDVVVARRREDPPPRPPSRAAQLKHMLHTLFGDAPFHLDHDPMLALRQFNVNRGTYVPDANDPNYLVYRTKEGHRLKTYVRGDGAQLSDAGKLRKEIRKRKKATRPKRKWPSRPLRGGKL